MAEQRQSWIAQRAEAVLSKLSQFDACGDLTQLSPAALAELVDILVVANKDCLEILDEHERQEPSAFWFWLSVVGGLGGIALMDPTLVSVILTAGGLLGGVKAVYDKGAYLLEEQRYLGLYWDVAHRKDALGSELTRRGIPWATSP